MYSKEALLRNRLLSGLRPGTQKPVAEIVDRYKTTVEIVRGQACFDNFHGKLVVEITNAQLLGPKSFTS